MELPAHPYLHHLLLAVLVLKVDESGASPHPPPLPPQIQGALSGLTDCCPRVRRSVMWLLCGLHLSSLTWLLLPGPAAAAA